MSWGRDLLQRQRRRMAAWIAGILIAVLAVFGCVAYLTLYRTLQMQADAANDLAVGAILPSLHWQPRLVIDRKRFDHEAEEMGNAHGLLVAQIDGPDGRMLHRFARVPGVLEVRDQERWLVTGGQPLRILRRSISGPGGQRVDLVLAVDWSVAAQTLQSAWQLLVWVLVAGAGGAAIAAYWLAGRLMTPIQRAFDQQHRFIADASHELRTPLAILQAHVDVARHEREPAAVTASLASIATGIKRLSCLVDDLLTLARIEAQPPALVAFRLDELLSELLDDFTFLAGEAGVQLTGGPWAPVSWHADPVQLRRLLANLLDNAIRHTPAGGSVRLACVLTGERVTLQVVDTGTGIPLAEADRVFDRFYRAATSGRQGGGSGLGLAIARSIAQAHGGEIALASDPGRGTTVTVKLPRLGAPLPDLQRSPDPLLGSEGPATAEHGGRT